MDQLQIFDDQTLSKIKYINMERANEIIERTLDMSRASYFRHVRKHPDFMKLVKVFGHSPKINVYDLNQFINNVNSGKIKLSRS